MAIPILVIVLTTVLVLGANQSRIRREVNVKEKNQNKGDDSNLVLPANLDGKMFRGVLRPAADSKVKRVENSQYSLVGDKIL